jgi:serine/threonine protein kinase
VSVVDTSASDDQDQGDSNPVSTTDTTTLVIALVVVFIIIILIVALIIGKRKYYKPHDFEEMVEGITVLEDSERVTPRELKRATVKVLDVLGEGQFGTVNKGLLEENDRAPFLVAIKALKGDYSETDKMELLSEAALTAQFQHDNVIRLVGVVTSGAPILVVLEFCEHGSLLSYLKKYAEHVEEEHRLQFAHGCACGLAYLSSRGFVHRDIASRNILLSSDMTCKVADFGLSREGEEGAYYAAKSGGMLPIRWTAPEALDGFQFSKRTDIWAYGVLLHEIWGDGEMPYKGWTNQKVWVEVSEGYRLPKLDNCPTEVYEIMLQCWAKDPMARITADMVVSAFASILGLDEGSDSEGEEEAANLEWDTRDVPGIRPPDGEGEGEEYALPDDAVTKPSGSHDGQGRAPAPPSEYYEDACEPLDIHASGALPDASAEPVLVQRSGSSASIDSAPPLPPPPADATLIYDAGVEAIQPDYEHTEFVNPLLTLRRQGDGNGGSHVQI